MKPRRLLLSLLGMLALAGAALLLHPVLRSETAPPSGNNPRPDPVAGSTADEAVAAVDLADGSRAPATPLHPLALSFGDASIAPGAEPAVLLEMLEGYRRLRGAFPTAEDNAALMRQLTGREAGSLAVFPEDHPRLDESGALLDAWGTPFFFHHLSSQAIEIRSAGPDQEFFTNDDVVVPPPRDER